MQFFCPDSAFDKSLSQALDTIKKACEVLQCTISYVHICHDEFTAYSNLLAGGGVSCRKVSASQNDVSYIDSLMSTGYTYDAAFCSLIMAEIYNRIKLIQSKLGANVKVLCYADAFDPQANGKDSILTFLSNPIVRKGPINSAFPDTIFSNKIFVPNFLSMITSIGSTKGIVEFLRANLVLVPWCYSDSWNGFYNPNLTFDCFQKTGFKFLYLCGQSTWDALLKTPGFDSLASTRDGITAMKKYVKSIQDSVRFRSSCLGYGISYWESSIHVGDLQIIKNLSVLNNGYLQ